jgi:uncharacterized protein involved in copper resistance
MDEFAQEEFHRHAFERQRGPTSEAEFERIEAADRARKLKQHDELLSVLVDIARTGGGL